MPISLQMSREYQVRKCRLLCRRMVFSALLHRPFVVIYNISLPFNRFPSFVVRSVPCGVAKVCQHFKAIRKLLQCEWNKFLRLCTVSILLYRRECQNLSLRVSWSSDLSLKKTIGGCKMIFKTWEFQNSYLVPNYDFHLIAFNLLRFALSFL